MCRRRRCSKRYRRWAASSGGGDSSDPTTWFAWAHRGHRLWAAMPDAFWVYMYKVHRCPQASSHDWTRCPYAHKGERARRRDPRSFSYLAVTCPAFRESQHHQQVARTGAAASCTRGFQCRYAHGVFELWLHPARFRTTMCEAGLRCPRRVCFFAHFPAELRAEHDPVPLEGLPPPPPRIPRAPPQLPPAPLSFPPRRVDLAMQALPGQVRLYGGGAGVFWPSPPVPARDVADAMAAAAVPVVALPAHQQAPPDDEGLAGKKSRRASEDGSVGGDYPHFDLIRDMIDDERES
ncbi:unnamed protein product [Urochloa decumbens]|uniref:AtC3H23-like CCCH zinc finger domain-containing protein n=2 Tax=Urochloa decumbens TaxID=240449 RepID=A0ABC9ERR1_9POAL